MRWCAFLLFVAVVCGEGLAAVPSAQAPMTPQREGDGPVVVGDRLRYRVPELVLTVPPNGTWRLQAKDSDSVGWYLDQESLKYDEKAGVLSYSLVPLRGGAVKTPPLEIANNEGTVAVRIASQDVVVTPARKSPEDKPPEFQPPLSVPVAQATVAFLGLLALGVLGGLIWLFVWIRRRKPRPVETPAAPSIPIPLEDEICARLERLATARPWERGEFKPLYFGVSEILKDYLGRRFGFDALECTTGELLQLLEGTRSERRVVGEVDRIFRSLDLIKFTDTIPSQEEASGLVSVATRFVRSCTAPAPVPPISETPAGGPRAV